MIPMPTLRDRFDAAARAVPDVLLGEDWVFAVSKYPAFGDLGAVYGDVALCEAPLAITRRPDVAHAERPVTIRLDAALCLNGVTDAVDLLFRFTESFQRPLPVERVANTADAFATGDFGLAWSWEEGPHPSMVAFVRHNVLVLLQGQGGEARVASAAAQIDADLRARSTALRYAPVERGFFSEARGAPGTVPRVPARGRLPIGSTAGSAERHFFLTKEGSVNRDPQRTDDWYYRAGSATGRREIVLYRVGDGVLPVEERLTVDVTEA
jgi:hypothetical protein